MRQSSPLYIGMDVHKDASTVADGAQEHGAEGMYVGTIGTRPCDLDPLSRKMPSKAKHLIFIDDAGPWGDGLSRELTQQG
jgi:transposase